MAVVVTVMSPDLNAMSRYRGIIAAMADQVLPSGQKGLAKFQESSNQGVLSVVLGRQQYVKTHKTSILAGVTDVGDPGSSWWQRGASVPDGSFILIRAEKSRLEVISDYCGTKTIWYTKLGCGGIAVSSCFEMLTALLGDFSMDERALGWFLSSGTCGPKRSWDKRVSSMLRNSRLDVRFTDHVLSVRESKLEEVAPIVGEIDENRLREQFDESMSSFEYGRHAWHLALSGGSDSRAILHGSRHVKDLTCVTWADSSLQDLPNSDVDVARELADRAGRDHELRIINKPQSAEAFDLAMRKFIRYSDGRIDNFFAYIDGMQMWDDLSQSAGGLFRGDELFGSIAATKSSTILHNMRMESFSDFAPSRVQTILANRHNHATPAGLIRRPEESIAQWRWRLRADYEIPTVYAALGAIRSRFVESACPLLSRKIISLAKAMSDKQLDDKSLFMTTVSKMYPGVPFAKNRSIIGWDNIFALDCVRDQVLSHLDSDAARQNLGADCVEIVRDSLSVPAVCQPGQVNSAASTTKTGMRLVGRIVPSKLKRLIRNGERSLHVHLQALAVRSYFAQLIREEFTKSASVSRSVVAESKRATA